MKRVFKLYSELVGKHIRTTVFSGEKGYTLANCGTLTMDVGEWQVFGALLLIGSERTGNCDVICEGDEEVVMALQEQDR